MICQAFSPRRTIQRMRMPRHYQLIQHIRVIPIIRTTQATPSIPLTCLTPPTRAVQRTVLSPKCNTIQRSEAQRELEDSAGGKSLNLCEATESFGGRLEVVRTFSFALWDDSRPASRRGQTLSVTSRAVVLRFRHGERRQFLSRHPHLPQGASAKAEQSLRDQVEEAAGAYRDPLYFAGAEPGRCRKGLP